MLLFVCFSPRTSINICSQASIIENRKKSLVCSKAQTENKSSDCFNSLSITMLWWEKRVPLNNSWVVKAPFDTPSVDLDSKSTRNLETQHHRYSKMKMEFMLLSGGWENGVLPMVLGRAFYWQCQHVPPTLTLRYRASTSSRLSPPDRAFAHEKYRIWIVNGVLRQKACRRWRHEIMIL